MTDTQQFLDEYFQWSSQEKFKDFGFIDKVSEKWKDRLLNKKKFNLWAFLFGPFYYLYLGFFLRGIIYTILSGILLCFGIPTGVCLYLVLAMILALRANTNYFKKLQKTRKVYADFNPDADTPYFNISSSRLIILSLLTGGFYLIYWGYRNFKAIKTTQKDDISPFWSAVFMGLTSINAFRSIAHSAKLVNYTKKLRPVLSAWLFLFLFGGGSYNYRSQNEEEISIEILFMVILIAVVLGWLLLTLLTLLVNKYQKAIRFYCEQKGLPRVKGFTFWEIVLIILGVLSNLWLFLFTAVLIRAFW